MNGGGDWARKLGSVLTRARYFVATAESCTGGLLAKKITDVPGSSAWFDRAFITYNNSAKQDMLGVSASALDLHGAVSEEVVRQMAHAALEKSSAQVTVAISGVAGPDGGSELKPVGTVWFAWCYGDETCVAEKSHFDGDRLQIREHAAEHAMQRIIERLQT